MTLNTENTKSNDRKSSASKPGKHVKTPSQSGNRVKGVSKTGGSLKALSRSVGHKVKTDKFAGRKSPVEVSPKHHNTAADSSVLHSAATDSPKHHSTESDSPKRHSTAEDSYRRSGNAQVSPERRSSKSGSVSLPSTAQIRKELDHIRYRSGYSRVLRSTVYTLITVAAIAILVATLWLPVLQIYGASMEPTLTEGDIVLSMKGGQFAPGDIVAFYYNNKILVKRVIGNPGDWVDIDQAGNVYVNNIPLDEPYILEKDYGICDLELPYQVPEGKIFVMGDNRNVSLDSRSKEVGCVAEEQIVGRLTYVVWPLKDYGEIL